MSLHPFGETSFSATRGTTGSGAAKELHDLLESRGVSGLVQREGRRLGTPLLREIDKGLAKSRVGIVLVTPALLRRLPGEGIADKELSALFARDLLVPIVHDTTYEALREVSPLLGSRSGLSTAEEPMANVAAKLASWSITSFVSRMNGSFPIPATPNHALQRAGVSVAVAIVAVS